jgi:hypothetical protein
MAAFSAISACVFPVDFLDAAIFFPKRSVMFLDMDALILLIQSNVRLSQEMERYR